MIVRHQGRTLIGDELVIGYVVCQADKMYIYQENGDTVQVKKSTIAPILTDEKTLPETAEETHPLCCLNVSPYILYNIRAKGVCVLEDLKNWTYKDFEQIRGLGKVKIRKIMEVLESYGIVPAEKK